MITLMTVTRENGSKVYQRTIALDYPMSIDIKQSESGLTLIGLPGVLDWVCVDAENPVNIKIGVFNNETSSADNTEDQEH